MKVIIYKLTTILLLLIATSNSYAALPPYAQNGRDMEVMLDFIRANRNVMATLDMIDFRSYTVYYRGECKAVFGRKTVPKLPGWVGPADPLELKSNSCTAEE